MIKIKKVVFVIDVNNWAFDIEAKLLKEYLKGFYDIDIICSKDYDDNLFLILEQVKRYDLIHIFFRKLLLQFDSEEFNNNLILNNYDRSEYLKICNKISTGIYDHLFLENKNIKLYENVFNKYINKYYTCSKKLEKRYTEIESYKNPYTTIHDTYDNNMFNIIGDKQFSNEGLVIGWVGNSKWNIKYKDFKGFYSILNPVIDELINENYNIIKNFADKNIVFRENYEMPDYYKSIDVCIITSSSEGTPRPLIEAMACGLPIITTDVGIASEILGPLEKNYIIGNRLTETDETIKTNLKNKIIELYNNKEELSKLSKENISMSFLNDIEHTITQYKKYFDSFFI